MRVEGLEAWFGMLIRVSIVEDDRSTREMLKIALDSSGDFRCVGAYANARTALTGIRRVTPDLVLMDIRLKGMSGIECTQRLKTTLPSLRVIMITGVNDIEVTKSALNAGANGYLTKPFRLEELFKGMQYALAGGKPIAHELLDLWAGHHPSAQIPSPFDYLLTPREKQMMPYLAKGLLYKEIAALLEISPFTVRQHVHNIYARLEVQNRAEAVDKFFPRGQ